jgi:hypothetical protein
VIFDSFSTEESYDVVKVYDGMSVTGTLLGEFSGTTTPGVLAAKSGSVFVRFTSDSSGSLDGVGMRWSDTVPGTLAPTALPTFTGGTPSHAKPDEDALMLLRACITPYEGHTGLCMCFGATSSGTRMHVHFTSNGSHGLPFVSPFRSRRLGPLQSQRASPLPADPASRFLSRCMHTGEVMGCATSPNACRRALFRRMRFWCRQLPLRRRQLHSAEREHHHPRGLCR